MTHLPASLVDMLRYRAEEQPNQLAYRYLVDGEFDEVVMTYEDLDRRARSIAALLQSLAKEGDRALIIFPPGLDFIAAYFGDASLMDCGVCDNCLRNKAKPLTEKEFSDIHQRILQALQQPADSKSLLQQLNGIKKEKAWKVINFLKAENKLEVDSEGIIRLKI